MNHYVVFLNIQARISHFSQIFDSEIYNYNVKRHFLKGYLTIDEKSGQNISIGLAKPHGNIWYILWLIERPSNVKLHLEPFISN